MKAVTFLTAIFASLIFVCSAAGAEPGAQGRKTASYVLAAQADGVGPVDGAEAEGPEEELDDDYDDEFEDPFAQEGEKTGAMPDPIEPVNRAVFVFNDKLYYWVLKPAARGYGAVVPEKGRVGVKRFFTNITMPIRFVNSLLQLKFEGAAVELARFAVNTTFGIAGFRDPATETWKMPPSKEDFGQTLGFYGAGPGFFINLPFLGPSSLRDGIGRLGDLPLDPTSYAFAGELAAGVGVEAYETVNSTSLSINLYDDMKKESLDPYSYIRDAFHQYRENLVRK